MSHMNEPMTGSIQIIEEIVGDAQKKDRLLEMGLVKNTEIEIVGHLPFQGATLIRFETTLLALRKEEFQCLKLNN